MIGAEPSSPGSFMWHAAHNHPAPNPCALQHQCLCKPFSGEVATQSFFARPIEDEAGHGDELPAELVVAGFVGKQGPLARSSSLDPLAEKFSGLDRARWRGWQLGIFDFLRTELAQ